jgi:hypothetical protein
MPELAHRIESYEPQPDPVAQAMQQLEVAKVEAEIAEIRAKTQKLLSEAGLAQTKQGTEQAKAGHLKSDTDLKNLQFVEQESGTQHARRVDEIATQARSQADLAVTQHELNSREIAQDRQFDLVQEYIKNDGKKKLTKN